MSINLVRISYSELNARQKENYNFQKVSAILADYGFVTMRLSDDWQGADFIAQHIDGETFLKIQLKSRLTFGKKYLGKGIYIAFQGEGSWFLFPHDELLEIVLQQMDISNTESWSVKGGYSYKELSMELKKLLDPYRIFPFDVSNNSPGLDNHRDDKKSCA